MEWRIKQWILPFLPLAWYTSKDSYHLENPSPQAEHDIRYKGTPFLGEANGDKKKKKGAGTTTMTPRNRSFRRQGRRDASFMKEEILKPYVDKLLQVLSKHETWYKERIIKEISEKLLKGTFRTSLLK